jgi:UDP-N-acetylglucosamine---dolichyl-phosphate N-acetylglucosaminyltransferase
MVTLCALIAAFNEQSHITDVVKGTASHASPVVVVDDGSTDDTAARARDAGAIVIRHEQNRGKGCAIRTGLEYVLKLDRSHVLFLDADLQHDPAEVPRLIARAEQGHGDFVLGERELRKDTMPAARFYANVIGSAILSRFIGADVADSQSGFRLIRADLLRRVQLTGTGYEIETEMLIKLVRNGATVDRVRVRRLQYEGAQSKIRPFWDTLRTCLLAVQYRYLSS